MARDCITLKVGDQLPTIQYYTKLLSSSRGIIQLAIAHLHECGGIKTQKSGASGTTLTEINYEKVAPYTNWNVITMSLPLPRNDYFSSLTTAINRNMEGMPIATAFAHTSGSNKRLQLLKNRIYDIIVVPHSTAIYMLKNNPSLNPPLVLKNSVYSNPFYLYTRKGKAKIYDRMTVMVDPTSFDQYELTKKLFKTYNMNFFEVPYLLFSKIAKEQIPDAFICREEEWTIDPNRNAYYQKHSLSKFMDYNPLDSVTPAVLTSSENYRIYELVSQYLNPSEIAELQQKVLRKEEVSEF